VAATAVTSWRHGIGAVHTSSATMAGTRAVLQGEGCFMGTYTMSDILANRPGIAQIAVGTAAYGDERHTWIDGDMETPEPVDVSFEDGILALLPILYRVGYQLTHRHHDAEDLAQETVARALSRRAQFHPGTNLRAWLLTIERSIFLNCYRRVRNAPPVQSMDAADETTLYGTRGMRASSSAEHVLMHGRIDDEIVDALRTLPAHYRAAVLLFDVHGLSYAEIAQQTGCALGTVMSRLHRGRALLRRALAGPGSAANTPVVLSTAA
jgi:RNA polymerase sigma-70 factor (ECF subfamily)